MKITNQRLETIAMGAKTEVLERMAMARELLEARKDVARVDWCEKIAAANPELQKYGLVPMTRAAMDVAMQEGKS